MNNDKKTYEVTLVDGNNTSTTEKYKAKDVIALFMILAKEAMHRELEGGLKKLIIEDTSLTSN